MVFCYVKDCTNTGHVNIKNEDLECIKTRFTLKSQVISKKQFCTKHNSEWKAFCSSQSSPQPPLPQETTSFSSSKIEQQTSIVKYCIGISNKDYVNFM